MKDFLAERLLARVMGWFRDRVSEERPLLQALAGYKYDEYQQFSTGSRFVESLALWLRQFGTPDEREAAYRFVKERLVFLSSAEMRHLVQMAYPDHIRPHVLRKAAEAGGQNPHHIARVAGSLDFKVAQRQCLFLGLSDGARIDMFRRANPDLSTEQILQTYEITDQRAASMIAKLREDLAKLGPGADEDARFSTVVLLDDFSASGRSYYMPGEGDAVGGKIADFFRRVCAKDDGLSELVHLDRLELIVLLYAATTQAQGHIAANSERLWGPQGTNCHMEVVQLLPAEICMSRGGGSDLEPVILGYYDEAVHDRHMQKGGSPDSRYGFADCGLPLVLHHNTPNNSIALLWSYEGSSVRGLFPRVRRHKEGV